MGFKLTPLSLEASVSKDLWIGEDHPCCMRPNIRSFEGGDCLYVSIFIMLITDHSTDFIHDWCVATDPMEYSIVFWCNMDMDTEEF